MLCFIFGAFRTVRTIAQFGSALDWGSRGRGFKSRWSDQESPSFRRFHSIETAGFSASRGGQGRCTTDLRPGACDTDALPFPSCAGSVLLGTRRSGRMARSAGTARDASPHRPPGPGSGGGDLRQGVHSHIRVWVARERVIDDSACRAGDCPMTEKKLALLNRN